MTPDKLMAEARRQMLQAQEQLFEVLKNEKSRKRAPIIRDLHMIANMLHPDPRYFSQAGQDRVVDRFFEGKRNGTFADIGGYDGIMGSNTLFFEIYRGWSGILVEPSPTQLAKAKEARRCPCLPYAVAGEAKELEFMEVTSGFTQMSGFLDSYDPNLLAQVRGDTRHEEVIHKLEAKPLGEILSEAGLEQVDFVSLDVEGGEMDILENFDFDAFDVTLWSIENNTAAPDIPKLMLDKGYQLVEFAGVDDIYRKGEP